MSQNMSQNIFNYINKLPIDLINEIKDIKF